MLVVAVEFLGYLTSTRCPLTRGQSYHRPPKRRTQTAFVANANEVPAVEKAEGVVVAAVGVAPFLIPALEATV